MKAKLLLVFALLLTAVTGAWAQEDKWNGDTHTATSNETIEGYINVENDATLTISDGVTVTVKQGITISEGNTLTVVGPGTLVVNGRNGYGDDAVEGNIIIQNANVIATGGDGGQGDTGNTGGQGGYAFNGSVTILSGSVTATGGQGGQGGDGGDGVDEYDNGGDGGDGGYGGDAFVGTLTYYAGYVKATGGEGGYGGQGGQGGDFGNQGVDGSEGPVGFAFTNEVTFMTTDYSMTDENGNGIIYVSNNKIVEITSTATIISSGNCGATGHETDVVWALTLDYTLVISGSGAMMYYGSELGSDSKYHSTAPWHDYDDQIQKVVVNNGVTYVGSYAFAYCPALTSVSLPASVTALGNYVCYSSNVARIDIPSTTAATIGTGGFDACPAGLQIAVPSTLLGTYQTATNWSAYAAKMVGVLDDAHDFNTDVDTPTGSYEYSRVFKEGVAATLCLPFAVSYGQISPYGKVYTFAGVDKTTEPTWTVVMQETNKTTDALTAYKPYLFMPYIFTGKGTDLPITFHGNVSTLSIAGTDTWQEDSYTGSFWSFQGVTYYYVWNEGHENLGKIYGFAAQNYYGDGYTVTPGDFVKAAAGASIAPFRAFLQYTPAPSNAPRRGVADNEVLPSRMSVRLVNADGTVTAIGTMDTKTGEVRFDSDAWYSIDGSRLNGKPAQKGVYINNGKKIIIK